jgi:hypothetical protein
MCDFDTALGREDRGDRLITTKLKVMPVASLEHQLEVIRHS